MADSATAQQTPIVRSVDGHGAEVIARVREALRGLRYGEVTVIVQDGIVVQIERTEKLRLRA
jgi:hypothetical protein